MKNTPRLLAYLVAMIAAGALAGCAGTTGQSSSSTDTLSKIAQTQTIRMGYREDSAPFSYDAPNKKPAGYSVELCKRVVSELQAQLKLSKLDMQWIPVTAANRFDATVDGRIDLECGSTSRTLGREEKVDFSLPIFVEGGSFISPASAPLRKMGDLNGKRLGIVPNTTTDNFIKNTLPSRGINPQIVPIATHSEGITALREKRIDAYATDRMILMGEAMMSEGGRFVLSDDYFSLETYGLMMRRDANFRLAVNRALAKIYRSGEIKSVFIQSFGHRTTPAPLLEAMFILNAVPE